MTARFDSVAVGDTLELTRGPLTEPILMRWSAAMENWHRIHYDHRFVTEHEKLAGLLLNGSLKQQFIVTLLKDWVKPDGWVWKIGFQFRAMNFVGETLSVWARVKAKTEADKYGLVELDLGIRNGDGKESTPGHAVVALPYLAGPPVPYPFVPPA